MYNENGKCRKHHAIYLFTDSHTCAHIHRHITYSHSLTGSLHGYLYILRVWFLLFGRVFALTRLMLPLLYCFALVCLWCILSRAHKHIYTRTRTQTNRKRIERQNSILFHIRCRVLACSPNFLRVSHLSSYTYLRHSEYISLHAYMLNIKFHFFIILIFFFVFCTQYYLHTSEKFLIIKLQSL